MNICVAKLPAGALLALMLLMAFAPLQGNAAEAREFLDISINIFTPALPTADLDETSLNAADKRADITTEIRSAEARYLALYLRYRLEASGNFGAVRVLPVPDDGADLLISGAVLASDGRMLTLAISALDSTGRVWLDQQYSGTAVAANSLNDDVLGEEDFAYVFSSIVADLENTLEATATGDLAVIRAISLLKYGEGLTPGRFSDYLLRQDDGTVALQRLPAAEDPLLLRIRDIREHEYLFIDVVDEEYRRFYQDIKPVYDMWRSFRREQAETAAVYEDRENGSNNQFRPGSYYALQESYNNYRWAKLQELYLDELSEGFANETEDTSIELEDRLFRLSGSLEQQYREWRSILGELANLDSP